MERKETRWCAECCINLGREMGKWRALENMVMNFQVPCNMGNFLTS